jgi:hypothetical protein
MHAGSAKISRRRWIRGRDRRSFLQRIHDRRAGEAGTIHIFGDSHSWALGHVPRSVLHDLPGTTMFCVGRDRAWFLRRTRRRRGRRSALLLTFGEIDVRVHVREIAGETGLRWSIGCGGAWEGRPPSCSYSVQSMRDGT